MATPLKKYRQLSPASMTDRIKNQKLWSFIWGVVASAILVIFGYFFTKYYGITPFTYPLELYIVVTIFSATVGLYFAGFWMTNSGSTSVLFGFLLVLFVASVFLLHNDALTNYLFVLGFLFGFSFVLSGAIDKQAYVAIFLKRLLRKFSWYIFGLQLTSSFEIPLFQKLLVSNVVDIANAALIIMFGCLFIIFVVLVHKYIDSKSGN